MTGKSQPFANQYLQVFFNSTASSSVGIFGSATAALTQYWISLHTGAPGTASARQDLNETTYTGYARVAVTRQTGGFTVSTNSVTLAANVTFATCSSSGQTINWFGVGSTSTTTGYLYYAGTCTPTVTTDLGVIPTLTTGTTITEN